MKNTRTFLAVIFLLVAVVPVAFGQVASSTASLSRAELEAQVQAKAKELDAINQQMSATKVNLDSTKQQRLTLQQQINTLNSNIKMLTLGIQSDSVASQQLQLQIQSLSYDIQDINNSVGLKQSAIESILKEFQKNDTQNGNLLALFIKKGTLADSVLEAQTLQDLQSQLAIDIDSLRSLHDQYNGKLQESSVKKTQVAAHQADLQNKKVIVQDQTTEKQTVLVTTKNQESVYQKQLADLQKQQQQIASDIEALDAVLRLKIDPSTLPPLMPGILLIPIQGDTKNSLTQGYGSTSFAQNGYRGHWHNGIDLAASIGTPVLAAENGTVMGAGDQDLYCRKGAYGRFVAINHTNGLTTLYGHLSRILVAKGDIVKRGQVIGYSGQTGYATGPHLHFTVYAQSTFYMGVSRTCGPMPYGGDLNPIGYLF